MYITTIIFVILCCILQHSISTNAQNMTPPNFVSDPHFGFKFQSSPSRGYHANFIKRAMNIVLRELFHGPQCKNCGLLYPNDLRKRFDFTLQDEPICNEELLNIIKSLFKITPRPAHKFRLSRRVSGLDLLAVAGDWMATTMCTTVVIYGISPIYTLMEIKMTQYLSRKIKWEQTGDGIPTAGAGTANSMALAVALFYAHKSIRDIGITHIAKPLTIYVSQHASISWKTAAIYNGLGTEAISEIPVDSSGRMDTLILDEKLRNDRKNRIRIMVVATAGTPILGVIDPVEEISTICKRHGVWLHVDAEFGGGYLFASAESTFMEKLRGISGANSVTTSMWLFATPYPSSILLTKNSSALQSVFGLHVPYIYTGNDLYNRSYDRGDNTVQTTRRPEISKIWFAASRGEAKNTELFSQMEDTQLGVIEYLNSQSGFELVKQSLENVKYRVPLVSFLFVPKMLRKKKRDARTIAEITRTTLNIKRVLQQRGFLDISVSYLPHAHTSFPAFFTISLTNTRFTKNDIKFVADTIALIGETGTLPKTYEPPAEEVESGTLKLPNFPQKRIYGKFMRDILELAFQKGIFFSRKERCTDLKQVEFFDDPNTFDFKLPYEYEDLFPRLLKAFESLITFTPHLAHPYLIYQLTAGLDPYTYVADLITSVLNTPMISYSDGSAPFVLMEEEIIMQMTKRVYGKEGDGVIADGGSMANQIAIALAKYNLQSKAFKRQGMRSLKGKKFVIYLSKDAHYSTKKGAIFQGIGQNNTVEIESNVIGQMKVHKLIEAIEATLREGNVPLMVVITTGTTVYGAIDPVDAIVDVCKKYHIWCHVDGMFGGLAVMSDTHIGLFKGIERTDSWGADLHKLMGSTMVCTILITPYKGLFRKVFSLKDESQEEPDLEVVSGLNLIGRHAQLDKRDNVFKFWLLWKAKGRKGLEAHVNKIMSNKDYLISEIRLRENDGYELVIDNFDLTNICFRLIPRELNPKFTPGVDRNSPEWKMSMDSYIFAIEKEFVKNGIVSFITQSRRKADGTDTVSFIKFVMMGSALTKQDIRFLLDVIVYYASKIKPITKNGNRMYSVYVSQNSEINNGNNLPKSKLAFDPFGNLPKYYPSL